jgi:hypothetical protein
MCLLYLTLHIFFQEPSTRMLQRQNVPVTGDGYLERCTDMLLVGRNLYIVENRISRLQRLELGEESARFASVLATKGDGPGEIGLPIELFEIEDGGIGLRDNRGFIFFDRDDQLMGRINHTTTWISATSIEDRIYHLSFRTESEHLIEVLDAEGTRVTSIYPKFLGDTGVEDPYHRSESYFYSGKLLDDGKHLYYASDTQGKLVAIAPDGTIRRERSLFGDFGPLGKLVTEWVDRYWQDSSLMKSPQGYIPYGLFNDAYLANGKIYLLRWSNYPELEASTRKDIHVYDADTLEPIERLFFQMARGEWMMSFVVDEDGQILMAMDTLDDEDYQLVRLVPDED